MPSGTTLDAALRVLSCTCMCLLVLTRTCAYQEPFTIHPEPCPRQLCALVLSKLLQSCPDTKAELRADYLVGNTEEGGGSACLSMDNKVGRGKLPFR